MLLSGNHLLTERFAYLSQSLSRDAVRGYKVKVAFLRLKSNSKGGSCRPQRMKHRFSPSAIRLFVAFLNQESSCSRKKLYRGLVVGSSSDQLEERLGLLQNEIRSQWNWKLASSSGFLNNSRGGSPGTCFLYRVDFQSRPGRYLRLPPSGCCLEETTEHAFYYCHWVRPFWTDVEEWTVRINPSN